MESFSFLNFMREGSISDKQIVERLAFLEILRQKVTTVEIKKGDTMVVDILCLSLYQLMLFL